MNKQIIHFSQDLDKAEFYNLIVKVTDISSKNRFKEIWNELKVRKFTIYYFDDCTIEAVFKHRYLEVVEKFRQLEKQGWSTRK